MVLAERNRGLTGSRTEQAEVAPDVDRLRTDGDSVQTGRVAILTRNGNRKT